MLDEIEIAGVRAAAGEMPEIINLVAAGRVRLAELITHAFSLEEFATAYSTFTERVDGALKVVRATARERGLARPSSAPARSRAG